MQEHKKCLICEGSNLKKVSGYFPKHPLVSCKNCGFVFMSQIPTLKELEDHYGTYSYKNEGYLSPITIKSYKALLDEFEKYRVNNRILDVGCGRGWFLEEAKKRGWEVYGTEYSSTAVNLCESKGILMKSGKLDPNSFDTTKEFDVITSFEVLEHINNPIEELQNIKKLLRKGGLFYCTTPNFNSLLRYYLKADYNVITYPEHLTYFTKTTLNRLARSVGFNPVKFISTGFSINRLLASKDKSKEQPIPRQSNDEKLRENIDSKWYLGILKRIINRLLTLSSTGIALKGYYEKP